MSISSEDRALISAALEDRLDADQRAAFWQRIASAPTFADAFAAATLLEADLFETQSPRTKSAPTPKPDDEARRVVGISGVSPQSKNKNRQSKISPRPIPFIIYPISIAAAALLTAAIVVVYLLAFTTDPQPDPINPNLPGPPVATLIQSTGGTLTTPGDFIAEGNDYPSGEYTLTSGTAEFMLTNAVNVKLKGETRLRMRNNMNVALTRGSAEFVCPTDAKGFTVHLPQGTRVIDLGTRFRVNLIDGRASVTVIEGRVAIEKGDQRMPLGIGQTATLSAAGDWTHQLAEWSTDQPFAVRLVGTSHGPLAEPTATTLGAGLVAQPPLSEGIFDLTESGDGVMVVRPAIDTDVVDDTLTGAIAAQRYVEVTATVDGLVDGQTLALEHLHYFVHANTAGPELDARFGPRVTQAAVAIGEEQIDASRLVGEAVRIERDADQIWATAVHVERGLPNGLANGDRVRIRIYLAGGRTLGTGVPWNAATRIGSIRVFGKITDADPSPTRQINPEADGRPRSP